MRLTDYIDNYLRMSVSDAAKDYGQHVHPETFRTWVSGTAIPRPDEMCRIFEWSLGHVTPNDFYPLPKLPVAAGITVQADDMTLPGQIDLFASNYLAGAHS